MSEINWNNAFDGATHALTTGTHWGGCKTYIGGHIFAKQIDGNFYDKNGVLTIVGDNNWVVLDKRPVTTPRTAESSAVKTRKCHDLMCENMVEGNVGTYCGCNRPTTDDVDDTVTQRGERYGLFADGAVIMQDLKTVMRETPGWERLTPSQREALEMIQHKIGRVLNGDPMYVENFTDIAGYAILVKDEMLRTDGATDAKVTYVERTNGSWVELNKRTS